MADNGEGAVIGLFIVIFLFAVVLPIGLLILLIYCIAQTCVKEKKQPAPVFVYQQSPYQQGSYQQGSYGSPSPVVHTYTA